MFSSTACPDYSGKSRLSGRSLIHTWFFFLLVTQICFGQWYQQNSPTDKNLNAVTFIDANNGFAVGDSGIVLHTTEGGNNWAPQLSGTSLPLIDVFFINISTGWAVGGISENSTYEGLILKTTNGGDNWSVQTNVNGSVNAVYFINSNTGWAVGQALTLGYPSTLILKTSDGGTNWDYHGWLFGEFDLNDVNFANDSIGLAVGGRVAYYPDPSPLIIKTTDGGESWVEIESGSEATFYGVSFADDSTCYAVGYDGVVIKSTDRGDSWDSLTQYGWFNFDVCFTDLANGWIVGNGEVLGGSIWQVSRTTNGGLDWTSQLGSGVPVISGHGRKVYFNDSLNGWAVGAYGVILHTTNGGVSFVEEEQIDEIPTEFLLSQNYPNPFNPSTSIQYAVRSRQFVSLKVYDVLGSEIETLVNEEKPAGTYEVTWYAEQLPSGVYFYQLRAVDPSTGSGQGFIQTKKMLLLK